LERIIGDKSVRNMSRQDADKLAKAGISTKAFGEDPVSDLFGWGKDYGQLLSDYGIKVVPLYLLDAGHVKKQKQAVCRGLGVNVLNSAISGSRLYLGGRVFGVREQPEAASQGVRSVCERSEVNLGTKQSGVTETPQRAEISTGNAGLDARIADATARKVSFELDKDWLYVPVRKDAINR